MTEFKPIKEGKVREIYDNGDSLIMVATTVSLQPTISRSQYLVWWLEEHYSLLSVSWL